jgi:HAMP domain-containing protein
MNMSRLAWRICLQLAGLYMLIGGAGIAGFLLSKRYVSRGTGDLLRQTADRLLLGYSPLLLLLIGFTVIRLGLFIYKTGNLESEVRSALLWNRLSRFPVELFVFYSGFSVSFSQVFRFISFGLPPWSQADTIEYTKGTLFDISAFIALAVIHYSTSRWILRTHIRKLSVFRQNGFRFRSAIGNLVFIAACGLIFVQLRLFWYAYNSGPTDQAARLAVMLGTGLIVFLITFGVTGLMTLFLFRDMVNITRRFRELSDMERGELLHPIPIASPYETGELTMAFNVLQERFRREYSRLDQDMKLALHVQEQMLSYRQGTFGEWRIKSSEHRAAQIGGDFCDAVELRNNRLALVAGQVTGVGLPSALVKSMILMIIRSGLQDEMTSPKLLLQLIETLDGVLADGQEVHMGICILDDPIDKAEWASVGRMRIMVEQPDGGIAYRFDSASPGEGAGGKVDEGSLNLPEDCVILLEYRESAGITDERAVTNGFIMASRRGGAYSGR